MVGTGRVVRAHATTSNSFEVPLRLLRLQIKNFRNFRPIDCQLGPHVVLLGENGAGKSNLLHALRLVLDAELPDTSRYLAEEDFWEGVTPFAGNEIIVAIDLTDYQNDPAVLACLADHEVAAPAGWQTSVARLTYRYAPRLTIDKATSQFLKCLEDSSFMEPARWLASTRRRLPACAQTLVSITEGHGAGQHPMSAARRCTVLRVSRCPAEPEL